MNHVLYFTTAQATSAATTPLEDKELQFLLDAANRKIKKFGKNITIILLPNSFDYTQGMLWWRKDWKVTRYEMIFWFHHGDNHHEFKSYNWPAVPGDKDSVTSYRPYGAPGQVKTYLEGFLSDIL